MHEIPIPTWFQGADKPILRVTGNESAHGCIVRWPEADEALLDKLVQKSIFIYFLFSIKNLLHTDKISVRNTKVIKNITSGKRLKAGCCDGNWTNNNNYSLLIQSHSIQLY